MILATLAMVLAAGALATRQEFREIHMGVEVRIVVHGDDVEAARSAAREAFDRVRALDDALSDWREGTEAMRLPSRAGSSAIVSGRLGHALEASRRIGERTEGAFDAGLGALTSLWRAARREGAQPTQEAIARARASSGPAAWSWEAEPMRFTALRDGVRMDFGAIGQGLAADEALAALRDRGFPCALVDVSGDIALGAAPPGEPGWRIRVEGLLADDPPDDLLLHDCGVSTSGDRMQRASVGGQPIGHLIDADSGRPLPFLRAATVVATDATTADAVATALCVLPIRRAISVAERACQAARIDRLPEDDGHAAVGQWTGLRRASSSQAVAPREPEASHPSSASPASSPPGSPARPSS
jgi:thiamine biosynthesis lipoprotein